MSILDQELSQLEASLGGIEQLQRVAGFLAVLNAAVMLGGNQRLSRAALVRLKARFELLAASIHRLGGVVEQRIQTIQAELTDAG